MREETEFTNFLINFQGDTGGSGIKGSDGAEGQKVIIIFLFFFVLKFVYQCVQK